MVGGIRTFAFGKTTYDLRERAGNAGDRVYHLTYTGHDEVGRPVGCTVTVTVPHDQGGNR
ncbi:hypothetical protein [Micromonospora sp. LH3U1]|uniref:hypothetical protein n=1 Tax=Micromonospora sp. LH3U1 TaxID=3018339 RepID=UPI002349F063|nr:hypothetical protein [Micromonospora sp. LH3U1]WCN79597.1 hypothetical protein PCA76_21725 [Micromonospora sp. LH3U1]